MAIMFGTNFKQLAENTFVDHVYSKFQIALRKYDDVFIGDGIDGFFDLMVGPVEDTGGGCVAYVTLLVQLNRTNQVVNELMMGIGNSKKEALVYAVHDLVETVVSPILAIPSEGFDIETGDTCIEMISSASKWIAAQGRILSNDTTGTLTKFLDISPPISLVCEYLDDALQNDEQFHWVKIYYANLGKPIGEVRVDNEVHERASEVLENTRLPVNGPVMFRQFLTLVPVA